MCSSWPIRLKIFCVLTIMNFVITLLVKFSQMQDKNIGNSSFVSNFTFSRYLRDIFDMFSILRYFTIVFYVIIIYYKNILTKTNLFQKQNLKSLGTLPRLWFYFLWRICKNIRKNGCKRLNITFQCEIRGSHFYYNIGNQSYIGRF